MPTPAPVLASSNEHLEMLVLKTIREQGLECDLSHIDVARITDFKGLFRRFPGFKGNISTWTNLTDAERNGMFEGLALAPVVATDRAHLAKLTRQAIRVNGAHCSLNHIDVSGIGGAIDLFVECPDFEGDFSTWGATRTTNTCIVLNHVPLNPIVASDKRHLQALIGQAMDINGPQCDLNHIDVSGVEDFSQLFHECPQFNGDISRWDVSKATTMKGMFKTWPGNTHHKSMASQFNGDISNWDVSNVTTMEQMFDGALFNGDISRWNTSNVWNMGHMFANGQFNGDIGDWDVSRVRNFAAMFGMSSFAQDLSRWNTSSAQDMLMMFAGSAFNGDISGWNVARTVRMDDMFTKSTFGRDISCWAVQPQVKLASLYRDNPHFLAAQSMSPWIVRLHLANKEVPLEPPWATAFALTAPVAEGLGLSEEGHVQAIMATHFTLVVDNATQQASHQDIDGRVFAQ